MDTKSPNYQAARKIVLEQISQLQNRDNQIDRIEYWYTIAQKFISTGKHGSIVTREEALVIAALQFQILHGDHKDIIHKPGFIEEKSKNIYFHPNFRKDLLFEFDLYKEHAKLIGTTPQDGKRKYTELVRILKRSVENIFPCYIYSADKIEAKEIMVVVGETIVILNGDDQSIMEQFLVSSVLSCYDQHTAQNERERLRKQLGHVSNLHQLVVDIGKPTVLRILSTDRASLRKRLQDHILQAKEVEEFEKAIKEKATKAEQIAKAEQAVKSRAQSTTLVVAPAPVKEPEQIKCWLNSKTTGNFGNPEISEISEIANDVVEVFVRIQNKTIVVIHATTEEMLHEIQFDWIKGWRYEPTSEEIRTKLAEKIQEAAYTYHQFFLDLGNLQPPIRILTSDHRKLKEIFRNMTTEPTSILKEEYYCHFLTRPDPFTPLHEGTPKAVIVRMHVDQIRFRSVTTGTPILELPVKCIHSVDIQPIPEDHKGKYEKGIESFFVLNVSHWRDPVLLATDEVHHIAGEVKKIMSATEEFQKTLIPKVERDFTVRGKLFNGFTTTKNLLLQIKEGQLVVTETEGGVVHRMVPLGDIEGWALVVKASDTDQPLTISSAEPQNRDISQLLQDLVNILVPKPVEAISPAVLLPGSGGAKCTTTTTTTTTMDPKIEDDVGVNLDTKATEDSGSDIDLGDQDLSNSGEK